MRFLTSRMLAVLLACLAAVTQAHPMQGWPTYTQTHRDYPDDDYYYAPKQLQHFQNYYDTPAIPPAEVYGHIPYPYVSDRYGNYMNEAPEGHEERLAALPIGQETWYEHQSPRWQNNNDINAAFLDNLILTQMAQDAQKHRENARAVFPSTSDDYEVDESERDTEDEDVRELKALAGKPLYHVPKTMPRIEDEDYYGSDDTHDGDSFINWNGYKRSVTTAAPTTTTTKPKTGQKEVLLPGPGQTHKTLRGTQHKRAANDVLFDKIMKLWENKAKNTHEVEQEKSRRIQKRYVSGDKDLVYELRGLKHRIPT